MAYTTIDNPELYFQTKLYTGNSSTQSITFDGSENMQPDWVWCKSRSQSDNHAIFDSVRGGQKQLRSNTTDAELTRTNAISSFDSNGFSMGSQPEMNSNSVTYVAWNWKAGTAFSNDASATGIGTLDSSGSRNTTAGFSIISFTGTETSSQSIAHGLNSTPEMIIAKSLDVSDNWMVFNGTFSAQDYISFTTAAKGSSANVWTSLPSSTVINIGDNAGVNDDGAMIMYAFNSVKGFSKFGSYKGNGSSDGTFVYTGFRPAWVMAKNADASDHWVIFDNKRETANPMVKPLFPNLNNQPGDSTTYTINFFSNGFKFGGSDGATNSSGNTYVFFAFAESPLVNSNGVPNNAR